MIICPNCGGDAKELSNGECVCSFCGNHFSLARKVDPVINYNQTMTQELSGEEIYDMNINSVLEIHNLSFSCSGSGVIIDKNGLALTNAHVVMNEDKVATNLQVYNCNTKKTYKARVLATGKKNMKSTEGIDLALILIENYHEEYCSKIGDSTKVKNGAKVYYIGNSLGEGTAITSGIISDNNRIMSGTKHRYFMADAATNPGNSDCPLYNNQGELIAIHVSARNSAVGMKFSIPIEYALSFIDAFNKVR